MLYKINGTETTAGEQFTLVHTCKNLEVKKTSLVKISLQKIFYILGHFNQNDLVTLCIFFTKQKIKINTSKVQTPLISGSNQTSKWNPAYEIIRGSSNSKRTKVHLTRLRKSNGFL